MTDVSLILEGTYPYKTGGVATWVDSLVRSLPSTTFSVAYLFYGPPPSAPVFRPPANVAGVSLVPLNAREFPVSMKQLVRVVPAARIYHALSTGFAGLLGVEIKDRTGSPLLLTEHGIYWHEVALGVDELECGFKVVQTESGELQLGKTWEAWDRTFRSIARRTYATADAIATVCSFNQRLQEELGASKEKMHLIPNGVQSRWSGRSRARRPETGVRKKIALVARVTPIKDIKTFIRACALVRDRVPEAEFVIAGPTEHDPRYTAECRALASDLGLNALTFAGEIDVASLYPSVDVLALTSVSEGQPFAVLEAFAHGIPAVVTNTGGCPELVEPRSPATPPAGVVCRVGDPAAVAGALVRLLTDSEFYATCSREARRRVREEYDWRTTAFAYGELYRRLQNQEAA